jgi:phosphopantothenoylcysteine decarboxylase / phosphopantothenate---cysteine ligase
MKGANVHLVAGPVHIKPGYNGIRVTSVTNADEMYQICNENFEGTDIAVMSAAVADYKPASTASEKIKKTDDDMIIPLTKTKDILRSLGERKKDGQILIGFALETQDERNYAIGKMKTKNADMIVLNSLRDANAGFGHDTNKVTVFHKDGDEYELALASKKAVAQEIVNLIIKKIDA